MGLTSFAHSDLVITTELHRTARLVFVALGVACFLLLVWVAVSQYVAYQLANETPVPTRDLLLRAEKYLPNSSGLQARLAEAATPGNLSEAESHASRAVNLSRYNYKYLLTLATVKEKQGELSSAEQSLRQAAALAPSNSWVRLRLAKLLGEQRRTTEAVSEFRRATLVDHSSLAGALDFIWRISDGDVNAVESATNDDARSRLTLAHFLLDRSRAADAARVVSQIKDRAFLDSSVGATFLNTLMAAGYPKLTRDLWVQLAGSNQSLLIWNGSFEAESLKHFTHFDWRIDESPYARIAIDDGVAHTGRRSLRIDFAGRQTTALNNEIRQLILLNGGSRYRLQCYAKSEKIVSPQGPRVVVNSVEASSWLGASVPPGAGTSDWQTLTVDFAVPQSRSQDVSVLVTIKQTPVPGADGPTRGTVWFDDFTLTRLEK